MNSVSDRPAVAAMHLVPDETAVPDLVAQVDARYPPAEVLEADAGALIARLRAQPPDGGFVGALLREFGLETDEGTALMCLAEALGRAPDAGTADRLIADLLRGADWQAHLGHAPGWHVNAAAWGLVFAGRVEDWAHDGAASLPGALHRLVGRSGETVVRAALRRALRVMGEAFVFAPHIAGATRRARRYPDEAFSFDLLGEAALTQDEADAYLAAYHHAIEHLARTGAAAGNALSVKLSALHPRYEESQRTRVLRELVPRLTALVGQAARAGLAVTVDAEEARRLELMLDVFDATVRADGRAGSEIRAAGHLGLAVQAYQKRAPAVLDWMHALAAGLRMRIPVRLVKGAYWDSEVKRAQALGLDDYAVYTRKAATDVAYLACAARLLDAGPHLIPQFATHNAHTVTALRAIAAGHAHEFQRLHGMGEGLYRTLRAQDPALRCRVYAPVGPQSTLLAYLVRRLLENGANTSFVHHLHDPRHAPETLARDPRRVLADGRLRARNLPPPPQLFAPRRNARGWDCDDRAAREALLSTHAAKAPPHAAPPQALLTSDTPHVPVPNPAHPDRVVGHVRPAHPAQVGAAVAIARAVQAAWDDQGADARAACLERWADGLEAHAAEVVQLLAAEAGRTLPDAVAELREAADFCRYYAAQARVLFAGTRHDCPTGEDNRYTVHGRGVAVCISPWNFPLAIFVGQGAAALVTGNAVLAKPAPQTPLIAALAVRLAHAAGVPETVLQLLPGDGALGAALAGHANVDAVVFTGSLRTARAIAAQFSARPGLPPALIAESGGVNAMLVDASALPDPAVADILRGAFNSAGQRCSALRLLCVEEPIADVLLTRLAGALAQLRVGDPADIATDVGPLIDAAAVARVQTHLDRLHSDARLLAIAPLAPDAAGHFVAPQVWQIPGADWLTQEVFGPVLHVVRYRADRLDALLAQLGQRGDALTLGIHTRVRAVADAAWRAVPAGNVYVNRDMIGAAVQTQPFGGQGLCGTGPKAGGPLYLTRLVRERTRTVNTAAVGGNASLYARED